VIFADKSVLTAFEQKVMLAELRQTVDQRVWHEFVEKRLSLPAWMFVYVREVVLSGHWRYSPSPLAFVASVACESVRQQSGDGGACRPDIYCSNCGARVPAPDARILTEGCWKCGRAWGSQLVQ